MERIEAIKKIAESLEDELVICNIGFPSRELYHVKDSSTHFYMLGSMGMASSIGLGLALSQKKKVVVFDGDGSVLMNMGTLVTIFSQNPENYILVVFDNQCYGSTGSQCTYTTEVDLAKIAESVGFKNIFVFEEEINFREVLESKEFIPPLQGEEIWEHPEWRGSYWGPQEICTSIVQVPILKKHGEEPVGIIKIENHRGTHVDAPAHFIKDGKKISDYDPKELVFIRPLIIDCPKDAGELIEIGDINRVDITDSDCIFFRTGFGKYRESNTEKYIIQNPGIAPKTISWIRGRFPDVRCLGIDSISISSYQKPELGTESHIGAFNENENLGRPLLLIEDLNLDVLSGDDKVKRIFVFPWFIGSVDSAPCSVLAELE